MHTARARLRITLGVLALGLWTAGIVPGQVTPPGQPAAAPVAELPPVPKGVEVLARGPVHEAFATPTSDPVPTKPVTKAPPTPLQEMPPEEKPEGNVTWIAGYWAWDDERTDYLWVSGIWRTPPPGKRWVAGYWREDGERWQWVPGFWRSGEQADTPLQQVTYLPAPPATPEVAPPGQPPTAESFYVPGVWTWQDGTYAWRAGYWAHVQPGYVWVPAHYRWTPTGYVFISGYWDLAVPHRGVLFAPVIVDRVVVGPVFVYTPAYVVRDTVVVDALFVRPACCHYYFGDYYGPTYRELGFESCVVYSRRHYDAIFVYERWEHRADPRWETVQLDVTLARHAGRAPVPPRTLVQQNITNINVIQNGRTVTSTTVTTNNVLVPSSQLAAAKGVRTVALDHTTRLQAQQQAQAQQQVTAQRRLAEVAAPAGTPLQPRVAALNVPAPLPVPGRGLIAGGAQPGAPAAGIPTRPSLPTATALPRTAPAPTGPNAPNGMTAGRPTALPPSAHLPLKPAPPLPPHPLPTTAPRPQPKPSTDPNRPDQPGRP